MDEGQSKRPFRAGRRRTERYVSFVRCLGNLAKSGNAQSVTNAVPSGPLVSLSLSLCLFSTQKSAVLFDSPCLRVPIDMTKAQQRLFPEYESIWKRLRASTAIPSSALP